MESPSRLSAGAEQGFSSRLHRSESTRRIQQPRSPERQTLRSSLARLFQTKLRHPYSESPFSHSLFEGKTAYRRGVPNIAHILLKLGLYNLPESFQVGKTRCRPFGVKVHGSGETTFAGARALRAARLDAKHYAFTGHGHPKAGKFQFGEQDFQLDERSDCRQRIRDDVHTRSVDVTSNALAVLQIPILRHPHEERRSNQPVAFGFSQLYAIMRVIVAFTPPATGKQ